VRCRTLNGDPPHRFTPVLTRQGHPHGFCLECSTALEAWEGQAGAREYQLAAREVGHALARVAAGDSYRHAARSARRLGDGCARRGRGRAGAIDRVIRRATASSWPTGSTAGSFDRRLEAVSRELGRARRVGVQRARGRRLGRAAAAFVLFARYPCGARPLLVMLAGAILLGVFLGLLTFPWVV
jgi:hypothetical protein